MKLELVRTYFPLGTNGEIFQKGKHICSTIELPWNFNKTQASCIPEGKYELQKRYSPRFGNHFLVAGVPGRSLILLHPANEALAELKGCIAPVSFLTGEGRGSLSRVALSKLAALLYPVFEKGERVYLDIYSSETPSFNELITEEDD